MEIGKSEVFSRFAVRVALGVTLAFATQAKAEDSFFGAKSATVRGDSFVTRIPAPEAKNYPPPGILQVQTTMYCGDGDVVNYANAHPDVSFYPGPQFQLVSGYWVAPAVANPSTTTAADWDQQIPLAVASDSGTRAWMAMGYVAAPIGQTINKMSEVNKTDPQGLISKLMERNIEAVLSQSVQAFNLNNKKYLLYSGLMACNQLEPPAKGANPSKNAPNAVEIIEGLLDLDSKLSSSSIIDFDHPGYKYDISITDVLKSDYTASVVNVRRGASYDASTNPLFQLGLKVLSYDKRSDFKDDSSLKSKLSAIYRGLKTPGPNTDCSAVLGSIAPESAHWYEPYPLQLTCKELVQPGNSFVSAYEAAYGVDADDAGPAPSSTPSSLPSVVAGDVRGNAPEPDASSGTGGRGSGSSGDDDSGLSTWQRNARSLASPLMAAGIMQDVQRQIVSSSSFPKPDVRCFSVSPLFKKVLGSVVIPLVSADNPAVFPRQTTTMIHPEGGFAIGQYVPYEQHDSKTIFGMISDSSSGNPFSPPLGVPFIPGQTSPSYDPTNFKGTFMGSAVSIGMNIRSVNGAPGSTCSVIYCLADQLKALGSQIW